jgi:uncharacterized protein YhaN
MDLTEIRDIALANRKSIDKIDNWASDIERRVNNLEQANSILVEVQMSLERLNMSNKFVGEKLDALQKAVEKISDDNQKQHAELSHRIDSIEREPGASWDKAKWIVIASLLAGIASYIVGRFIG